MTCLGEVPADVLRTCLQLTRHSSLWMNNVYRERTRPIGKWRNFARFSVHASVYGAPTRAKHISLSPRNH